MIPSLASVNVSRQIRFRGADVRIPNERKSSIRSQASMNTVRDFLFGDVPLAQWAESGAQAGTAEPWCSFARAQDCLRGRAPSEAIGILTGITQRSGLESRQYLQAWSALRGLGVSPRVPDPTRVYGVVIELGLAGGLDIVACYADHTARYVHHAGGGVVWEAPDPSLDLAIDRVLSASETVARHVGVWEGVRPPPPPTGQARLSVLTPAGIRFGQAPTEALMSDGLAGPVMAAGYSLLMDLIRKLDRPGIVGSSEP